LRPSRAAEVHRARAFGAPSGELERSHDRAGSTQLKSVQYVEIEGKRFAVVPVEDWEAMIEWLEGLEDLDIARRALAEVREAAGDRERAGWLRWDDVREEL
jgi:hypothetical protein